jgi:hypothetical protein
VLLKDALFSGPSVDNRQDDFVIKLELVIVPQREVKSVIVGRSAALLGHIKEIDIVGKVELHSVLVVEREHPNGQRERLKVGYNGFGDEKVEILVMVGEMKRLVHCHGSERLSLEWRDWLL